MQKYTELCFDSVEKMIKMGEGFSEAEGQIWMVKQYKDVKNMWVAWKKMISAVS